MEKMLRGLTVVFLVLRNINFKGSQYCTVNPRNLCYTVLVSLLLWPGNAFADGNVSAVPLTQEVKPSVATPPPAEEPSPGLLMSALGPLGLAKPLSKAGINFYGYVQSGYMADFTEHRKGPTYLGYDNFKNNLYLNKVSLNLERTVDPTKKKFDLGFRVEGIFGGDARFIHSNGLMDKQTGRYQWDLLQAYVDMALPYLPMKVRVGKWIELAGFEHFSANIYGAFGDAMRALYSYSYQFLYAEPGTQTGALVTYVLNPKWTFDAGITRGWNQSIDDANHVPDFTGRVTYTPDDKTAVIFTTTEGPEFPIGAGRNLPAADRSHWWNYYDLVVTRKITDKLSLGTGLDYVQASRIPGYSGGSKQFGGLTGYSSYSINSYFTLNTRAEWYADGSKGFSTGYVGGTNANYFGITQGVAIKPFPKNKFLDRLILRPELRYDFSDHSVFNNRSHNQLTFSTDMLFTF